MRLLPLAVGLLLVVGLPLASACEPTSSQPETAAGGFYVDVDCHAPTAALCAFCGAGTYPVGMALGWCSVWIYRESNDVDGLQRGDEFHDDTCDGRIEGDTVVF